MANNNKVDVYNIQPNIFSRSTSPSEVGIKIPMDADESINWKRGQLIFRKDGTFSNTFSTDAELVGILVNDIEYTATANMERQVDVYVAGWFMGSIIFDLQNVATQNWLKAQATAKSLSSPYSQTLNNTIILEVGT